MNVPGSLSIERNRAHWSKALSDGYPSVLAIGILAGIVVTFARTPLHLPGHKAIFWMAPILAARLVTRASAGASVGALSTATTTFVLGGRIAGGVVMMPLVILAGVVLDMAVQFCERRNIPAWKCLLLLARAALAANLICFIKRLFDPVGAFFSTGNLADMLIGAGFHALFGFIAGLLGAICGYGWLNFTKARYSNRAAAWNGSDA